MQEPIGERGVQAVPKIEQSVGFFTPRMMAGHWQAAFSGTSVSRMTKRRSASRSP
jgi:hypothetical protein